ncbi:MAG: hypothetical protein ACR5K5_03990, partial [Wolbachia sp.]
MARIPCITNFWQRVEKRKNFLDKLRQPPYHETEGIQLSSSVQIKQQENNVVGVLFLIFCT